MSNASTDGRALLLKLFPCISEEAVNELEKRGLLHVTERQWRLGDNNNGTTRGFSPNKWQRAESSGLAWHKLIGLDDVIQHDRGHVLLVLEGSKDALASAELARRAGVLRQTGIVVALGSGYRPIRSELEQLRGRWVGVIYDNDAAGIKCLEIVCSALADLGIEHNRFNWGSCQTNEKDIFAWLESDFVPQTIPSLQNFFSPLSPSQCSSCSSLQVFTSSSPETGHAGIGEDERLGIVAPFVVTMPGTGNAMSFLLARKIKTMKLDMKDIEKVFNLWFVKSQPLLPPDADQNKSLQKFFDQLLRVRFTDTGLKAACERACQATPPFIAARDGDVEVAKLAALHRELQRDAGNRAYICPIGVVVDFIPVRWRSQAGWLTQILEQEKVIECVDRGLPNKPGKKGRPTLWCYKLPLD
jgi:hypothetical protein